jgi:hypothetical protein
MSLSKIKKLYLLFLTIILNMNFKWLIIMMTLLALLTISAVSAAENATDANLTSASEAEVTFDEQMWEDNLSDIRVSLPDTSEGDFMVKINDEVIYNEPVREKSFTVPVKLPKEKFLIIATIWPPMDCRNYKVSFFLNNVEIISPKNLKVMKYSPDYDYLKYFPKEVLQHDNQSSLRYSLLFPRSAHGDVEVYLDNRILIWTIPDSIT